MNQHRAVLDKVQEELNELREAMENRHTAGISDEMGDVFFSCVNLARHLGLDAEQTLRRSTAKFERRFQNMEGRVADEGAVFSAMSEKQRDRLWRLAKDDLGN